MGAGIGQKSRACKARLAGFIFTAVLAALYLIMYAPMPKMWSLDKYSMLLRIAYIPKYCFDIGQEEISEHNKNQTRKKRILLWTPNFSKRNWGLALGSKTFSTCPEHRCELVTDRCLQPVSDALAFHLPVTSSYDLPSTRPRGQVWVVTTVESAAWKQPWLGTRKHLDGKFNLTATYKWDSDFLTSYFSYHKLIDNDTRIMSKLPESFGTPSNQSAIKPVDNYRFLQENDLLSSGLTKYKVTPFSEFLFQQRKDHSLPDRSTTDYTKNKTALVLWFVSNCRTKQTKTRISYAKELSKYVPINIYGGCHKVGAKPDPCKKNKECMSRLISQHKFYLSFENARCHWYISEKFSGPLKHKTVPVALGATLEEYKTVAPEDSFLHVDNFTSPKITQHRS